MVRSADSQQETETMRTLMMAALLAIGSVGPALAQGDVIAARREGLRGVGANLEAIAAVAQARGDTHTVMVSNFAPHGVSPSLFANIGYDAERVT
jgi:hypothetical protein